MSLESVKATVVEISASINAFHTAQSSSYQNDLALFRTIAAADCDSLPIIRPADSWTVQNTLLNTYLHDFRSQVLIIGNTCVKMALLINNLSRDKLDGPEARSIFTELDGHLRTLFSIFRYDFPKSTDR